MKDHSAFFSRLLTWDWSALLRVFFGGGKKWSMEYSIKVWGFSKSSTSSWYMAVWVVAMIFSELTEDWSLNNACQIKRSKNVEKVWKFKDKNSKQKCGSSYDLNGSTLGCIYRLQSQNHLLQHKKSFYLNSHNLVFHSQTRTSLYNIINSTRRLYLSL